MKNYFFLIFFGLLVSCSSSNNSESEIAKAEVSIKGMSCAMGCAKAIENKLIETNGILNASVNFDEKMAVFEYASNNLSQSEIIDVIESVNGGGIYSVEDFEVQKSNSNSNTSEPAETPKATTTSDVRLKVISFPNIFRTLLRTI